MIRSGTWALPSKNRFFWDIWWSPQHLAVVCGEDDPGVFEQVIFSQTAKDPSQCIVACVMQA